MALLLGAAAAKAAYDYGPAIYSGLKNEVKTMKHSKKHGLAKLGQGFSSFGEGIVKIGGFSTGREHFGASTRNPAEILQGSS